MTDSNTRIEQFRKMAEADPKNELGHFSLGREYMNIGDHAAAVESFERALALNPNLSKVYQLAAEALLKLERRDEAVARLSQGAEVAAKRGDLVPKREMVEMLQSLGAPVPEAAQAQAEAQQVGEGQVLCQRCGRVGPQLPKPPFRNEQGNRIYESICADCWREWIGMGTKVINELRLPLNDPQAQRVYDQHMQEFLNLK
jgi:Fe-S cluster biosynthesis and repair protein YggX